MTTQNIFDFSQSEGLKKEIELLEKEEPLIYHSLVDLQEKTNQSACQLTILKLHAALAPRSKILDVGCGFGESSLLLAALGHEMHSVEPSRSRCTALQSSASHLQLPVYTYVCTGEALFQTNLSQLDGCLFFSSLHHCDDPLAALKNVKNILRPGGVIVLNEPILKFYRTKAWYHKQLIENPIKIGHYGGNEHIYYFSEYIHLLKQAGFTEIKAFWSGQQSNFRKTLSDEIAQNSQGKYQYSVARCVTKYLLYKTINRILRFSLLNRWIIQPLLKRSVLQAILVARS